MVEISEELLRKIVREAVFELGPDADPVLLRKVVIAVTRRLALPRQDDAAPKQIFPPPATQSQY